MDGLEHADLGVRQAVDGIGFVPLAGLRTFEMRNKGRAVGGQIGIGKHVSPRGDRGARR